jgi:hypothetical protein
MLDSKTSATDLLMQRWRFPSFSVTSVECDSGVSNPTIIPNSVTATFSVRTVPDQTHDLIVASFEVNLLLVFLWFFSERKQPNEQNFVKDRFSALKSSNSLSFKVGKLLLFCFVCLKKKMMQGASSGSLVARRSQGKSVLWNCIKGSGKSVGPKAHVHARRWLNSNSF